MDGAWNGTGQARLPIRVLPGSRGMHGAAMHDDVRDVLEEAESATTARHFRIYRGLMLNVGAPALPRALAPVPVWNLAGFFRVICSLVNTAIPFAPLFWCRIGETFGNFAGENSRERRYSTL